MGLGLVLYGIVLFVFGPVAVVVGPCMAWVAWLGRRAPRLATWRAKILIVGLSAATLNAVLLGVSIIRQLRPGGAGALVASWHGPLEALMLPYAAAVVVAAVIGADGRERLWLAVAAIGAIFYATQ